MMAGSKSNEQGERRKGSDISPLLANLFMHYAFDIGSNATSGMSGLNDMPMMQLSIVVPNRKRSQYWSRSGRG